MRKIRQTLFIISLMLLQPQDGACKLAVSPAPECLVTHGEAIHCPGPWAEVDDILINAFERRTSGFWSARKQAAYCPSAWIFDRIFEALQDGLNEGSTVCPTLIRRWIMQNELPESQQEGLRVPEIMLSVMVESIFGIEEVYCRKKNKPCNERLSRRNRYLSMLSDLMPDGYVIEKNGHLLLKDVEL